MKRTNVKNKKEPRKIIPKSFKLGGYTYSVKYKPVCLEVSGRIGEHKNLTPEIIIYRSWANKEKISDQHNEATFCHELTHGILRAMGEEELFENEKFVEAFSRYLHQYLVTAKY